MIKLIKTTIQNKKLKKLREILEKEKVYDIVELLKKDEFNDKEFLQLFRILHKDVAGEVFSRLDRERQKKIVDMITDENLKELLDELFFDDMIDFLEEMPSNVVKRVMENTKLEDRKLINQFLSYEEDSAGSLMTIEYLALKTHWTVKESFDYIRKNIENLESIDVAYIIDNNKKLIGQITLKNLIIADENSKIDDIYDKEIIWLETTANQEVAIEIFKKSDVTVLPVVDVEKILVGIITIDDVVDAIEEENTEDIQKMAGLTPSKESYLESSVFTLAKNRLLWLTILMISDTFTGSIIRSYEDVIQKMVILAAAIPMLMDTGGNAGSQSSTLVIRSMALGELEVRDYLKVLWKEFRIGIVAGVGLATINFLRMFLLVRAEFKIAFLVSITLMVIVLVAKLIGGILPILARKLKIDPAIMTGPLVTTIVDAISLMIYFYLATLLFQDILN